MSNKLIANLMSLRSRMISDERTQVMFEGDFDTISQTIEELKRLEKSAKLWSELTATSTNITRGLREQISTFMIKPTTPKEGK